MPFLAESDNESYGNPETTVDASGRELVSKAITKMSPNGRILSDEDLQAPPAEEQATTEEVKTEETPKNVEAEARKLYLSAQKADRKAKEMEKKAAAGLAKAEAFEKARSMAESGEDPTALLKAAGLDPIKFYKDMTTYALRDDQKQEDPVKRELREHKEKLEQYAKANQELADSIKNKEELAMHNQNITTQVIPLLEGNRDKYETLLTEFGNNTALEIYKVVWDAHNLPDDQKPAGWRLPTFQEAADYLEDFYSKERESAIIAASKLKKFKHLFAQQEQASTETTEVHRTDRTETSKRSPTLSNKQPISSTPRGANTLQVGRYQTPDERQAEILKKFGP